MDTLIKYSIEIVNIAVMVVLVLSVLMHRLNIGKGSPANQYYNRAMFLTCVFFLVANVIAFTVAYLAFAVYDFHRPMVILLGNLSDRVSMLAGFSGLLIIGKIKNKISINHVPK